MKDEDGKLNILETPTQEHEEDLYEEKSALEQAMTSEEHEIEGTFLTGGDKREFVELAPEKEIDEAFVLNPKLVQDGQPLLDFLRKNLHKFDSPYAYIGGEANSPSRSRFKDAEVKVLIARLSTYESTSLSMSHSLMAQIYQELDYTFCDLAFMPKPNDYHLLRDNGYPVWFGTNTKLAPHKFDLLSITHAVSMEQLNFIALLHDSGIPIFKDQRMEREDVPLLILGGMNAGTTAPLSGAWTDSKGIEHSDIIDAVVYGDGEETAKILVRLIREGKQKGLTKREVLASCHGVIPGFYEPDLYEHHYDGKGKITHMTPKREGLEFPVRRATVANLDTVRTLESKILPFTGDGASVDVAIAGQTGCIGGFGNCTFCREGNESVYRERSLNKVMEALSAATKNQGNKEVSFFSLNFNQYTDFFPLVKESVKKGYKVGLISQRIDMLAETPEQVRVQRWLKKSNFTLGVEGISQRFRNLLNKNTSEEQILQVVQTMMESGAGELKFFYIVTGMEDKADNEEHCAFMEKVEKMKAAGHYRTRFRISFTPLFPSAFTPLQFLDAFAASNHGSRSLNPIFEKARELRWGRRLSVSGEEPLISNTINHGGRNITKLLIDSHFRDDWRFYGNVPKGTWARWKTRIDRDDNINLEAMWGEKEEHYIFPWDDIWGGMPKTTLYKSYKRSMAFQANPYCLTTRLKRGECHWQECKMCDLSNSGKADKTIIESIVNRKVAEIIPVEAMAQAARSREKGYHVRVKFRTTDPIYRFVMKAYHSYSIPRALMTVSEKYNDAFVGALGHARISAGANTQRDWTFGENIYDFSLCEHIPESELRAMIGPANKVLGEGEILDIRMDPHLTVLRNDVDFAAYSMFVPNQEMSYRRITSDVNKYFERLGLGRESNIKVKKTVGKGVFKTVELTLDGEDVRALSYQWLSKQRGTLLRFVISANYNPMAMLEAITKRKAFTWKKHAIYCHGYVQVQEETGEVDVFAALANEKSTCSECGGVLEKDLFTGQRFGQGTCFQCSLDQIPIDPGIFETKLLKAVVVPKTESLTAVAG